MATEPTRGATEQQSWSASPAAALGLRAVILLIPILASFVATRLAAPVLWQPPGRSGLLVFVAQAAVVGAAAALLSGRAARRLLPLAALFNLTLVFPDRAPSRFGVALRSGTLSQLKRGLATGEMAWPDDDQQAAEQLIGMVTELGKHERLTRGHSERVRAYADLIAQEFGLSTNDRQMLQWAAMVHDIGKLTVPAEILNKQGRPTDAEWAILKNHPAAGGKILEPLAGWLGDWRFAASQHHERWDGTGYPSGLAGNDISMAGRIVAVADAYDVITSKRSYKSAMSAEAARQEMVRCSGTQFDPDVVRALLNASLGKSRATLGFFGWLTELGGLGTIPRVIGQVVTSTATATAVVATAVTAATAGSEIPGDPTFTTAAMSATTADQPDLLPMAEPALVTALKTTGSQPAAKSTTTQSLAAVPTTAQATTATTGVIMSTATTTATTTTTTTATTTTTTAPSTTATTTTTTTASTTTTTTIPPPFQADWNLGSGGHTTEQAILPLDESPQSGPLPNYDTDRDGDIGLYVQKGDGLAENTLSKIQRWSRAVSGDRVTGTPDLTIWTAVKDFDTGKTGRFVTGIYDCDSSQDNCTLLSSKNQSFNQSSFGSGFGEITVTMPAIDHTFSVNRTLVLKVATVNASDDSLWFAYATTTYPSNLTIE